MSHVGRLCTRYVLIWLSADFSSAEFNDKTMSSAKPAVTQRVTSSPTDHLIKASIYGDNPLPPALNTLLGTIYGY